MATKAMAEASDIHVLSLAIQLQHLRHTTVFVILLRPRGVCELRLFVSSTAANPCARCRQLSQAAPSPFMTPFDRPQRERLLR